MKTPSTREAWIVGSEDVIYEEPARRSPKRGDIVAKKDGETWYFYRVIAMNKHGARKEKKLSRAEGDVIIRNCNLLAIGK